MTHTPQLVGSSLITRAPSPMETFPVTILIESTVNLFKLHAVVCNLLIKLVNFFVEVFFDFVDLLSHLVGNLPDFLSDFFDFFGD